MYEYKYVNVNLSGFLKKPKDDYHKIIDQHALEG